MCLLDLHTDIQNEWISTVVYIHAFEITRDDQHAAPREYLRRSPSSELVMLVNDCKDT